MYLHGRPGGAFDNTTQNPASCIGEPTGGNYDFRCSFEFASSIEVSQLANGLLEMNFDQFVLPFYEPGMKHSSLCSKAQIRIYIKKLVDEILGI